MHYHFAPKTPVRVSWLPPRRASLAQELDENEREHTKPCKRYRDEETTGNEFMKRPHDPNLHCFDQLCKVSRMNSSSRSGAM